MNAFGLQELMVMVKETSRLTLHEVIYSEGGGRVWSQFGTDCMGIGSFWTRCSTGPVLKPSVVDVGQLGWGGPGWPMSP